MKTRGFVVVLAVLLAGTATAAVFQYVRGVEDEAEAVEAMVEVIVARENIPSGTDLNPLLSQGVFTTRAFPQSSLVEGVISSLSQLEGQQTASSILAGEQITSFRLRGEEDFGGGILGIPEGHEALTVQLDGPRSAGGFVRGGDHVTVYATFGTPDDRTVVLVPDVLVLRVPAVSPTAGVDSAGGQVTLALTPEDAQRVVFAQERGGVWLGLLPPGQEGTRRPPVSYGQVSR